MDSDTNRKIDALEAKIDAIFVSVEKTRKYFFWTMVITVAVLVVPMIGLMFAIPAFMSNYVDVLGGI
ncbi:MAG: hypothetical protein UY04_C0025G0023 [Parcubacteria group bacterium GW2011_GWA2_47_7]|nr:MAG: hypothetical protein UY04_C0025G0023 [Parcubacteria group bacterium GW2011_GWA2_47_7]